MNGLTQAVSFWGSFIGNEIFDVQYVKDRISELSSRKENLEKYASTDGTKALVQMNQAIWGINTAIKSIQSMAKLLKLGASNTNQILSAAKISSDEQLSERDQKIYTAAINVLVNNLKSVSKSAADIEDKLNAYCKALKSLMSEMKSLSARLVSTA